MPHIVFLNEDSSFLPTQYTTNQHIYIHMLLVFLLAYYRFPVVTAWSELGDLISVSLWDSGQIASLPCVNKKREGGVGRSEKEDDLYTHLYLPPSTNSF